RVERINQAYGADAEAAPDGGRPAAFGWGLGSFWIRKQQRRRREAQARVQEEKRERYELDVLGDAGAVAVARCDDEDSLNSVGGGEGGHDTRTRHVARRVASDAHPPARVLEEEIHRPSSVWWWGPLQRWRLQDSTDYRS
ncbi:hypothetical protein BD413DRAFT_437735, partial [Trametes elegans]